MIDLYYWTTPNGHKITIFLEEAGLRYKITPVNISQGDQFKPEFLTISPNNRIPAIVDHEPKDGGKPIPVFESGAILLYLAEKTGKFMNPDFRRKVGRWAGSVRWPVKPSFQPVCAIKDPLCDRPICKRDESPLWRPRQAPCRSPVYRRRLLHRRHGDLSMYRSLRTSRPEVAGFSPSEAMV